MNNREVTMAAMEGFRNHQAELKERLRQKMEADKVRSKADYDKAFESRIGGHLHADT